MDAKKRFVDTCNLILNNDALFREVLKYFNMGYNNAYVQKSEQCTFL